MVTNTELNKIIEFAVEFNCTAFLIAEEWNVCKDNYEDISDYLADLEVTGDYDIFSEK
jgi:hypothetical protein